jgi:hypothetical protein
MMQLDLSSPWFPFMYANALVRGKPLLTERRAIPFEVSFAVAVSPEDAERAEPGRDVSSRTVGLELTK